MIFIIYELWLCELCNYDPEQIYKYINIFKDAKNAYNAKASHFKHKEEKAYLSKLFKADHSLSDVEKTLEDCKRKDIQIMSIHDSDYPQFLKNGHLPPRILFIKGERINFNDYLSVTIVGSRAATKNGKFMANSIAADLTLNGILVVSGLARGIDTEAHKGALGVGGKTVAFLAGGVDIIYPAENRDLYFDIINNGAVISERPPGTHGRDFFYQQRNRIFAALTYGTLFVEGEIMSGTAITAKHATDASRDVFAIPGSPAVKQSELPNSLIKSGAKMVLSAIDIIEEYAEIYPNLMDNYRKLLPASDDNFEAELDYDLDDEDKIIIDFLKSCGEAQFPDTISENCNLPISTVSSKLTMLMLGGILSQEAGNKYSLTRR